MQLCGIHRRALWMWIRTGKVQAGQSRTGYPTRIDRQSLLAHNAVRVGWMRTHTEKWCAKCDEWRPLVSFHRSRAARDGYFCNCKACRRRTTTRLAPGP